MKIIAPLFRLRAFNLARHVLAINVWTVLPVVSMV